MDIVYRMKMTVFSATHYYADFMLPQQQNVDDVNHCK
jgi:hypothetical protein